MPEPWKKHADASTNQDEGFFHSAADQIGISTLVNAARHPLQTAKNLADFQLWTMDPLHHDGGAIAQGINTAVGNSIDHLKQARGAMKAGAPGAAVSHVISAIPILGPGIDKAIDQMQIPAGDLDNSYSHRLYQTITSPGTMGTLAGLSFSLAGPTRTAIRGLGGAEALASTVKAVTPAFVDAIPAKVGAVLNATGEAQKAGAVKAINRTVKASGENIVDGGPNPGLGYFNEVEPLGISKSYGSIAQKASDLIDHIKDNPHVVADADKTIAELESLKNLTKAADEVGSAPPSSIAGKVMNSAVTGGAGAVGSFLHGHAGALKSAGIGAAIGGGVAGIGVLADSVPMATAMATGRRLLGQGLIDAGAHFSAGGSLPVTNLFNVTPLLPTDHRRDTPRFAEHDTSPSSPAASTTYTGQDGDASPLKGQDLWASKGVSRLTDHLQSDNSSGLTAADIQSLQGTRQGQVLLTEASNFSPGTPAMAGVVDKVKAFNSASQ